MEIEINYIFRYFDKSVKASYNTDGTNNHHLHYSGVKLIWNH